MYSGGVVEFSELVYTGNEGSEVQVCARIQSLLGSGIGLSVDRSINIETSDIQGTATATGKFMHNTVMKSLDLNPAHNYSDWYYKK